MWWSLVLRSWAWSVFICRGLRSLGTCAALLFPWSFPPLCFQSSVYGIPVIQTLSLPIDSLFFLHLLPDFLWFSGLRPLSGRFSQTSSSTLPAAPFVSVVASQSWSGKEEKGLPHSRWTGSPSLFILRGLRLQLWCLRLPGARPGLGREWVLVSHWWWGGFHSLPAPLFCPTSRLPGSPTGAGLVSDVFRLPL